MTTTRLARRLSLQGSSYLPLLLASSLLIAASSRNLLRTSLLLSVAATEGTRSPLTIPGRVSTLLAPTLLRTIALAQASYAPIEEL
jgi:hypothetical protein